MNVNALICAFLSLLLFGCSAPENKNTETPALDSADNSNQQKNTDVEAKNIAVNPVRQLTVEEAKRIIKEVYKTKEITQIGISSEFSNEEREYPVAEREHSYYEKGQLTYSANALAEGDFTGNGNREYLIGLKTNGLSHADGWAIDSFVIYSEDLKTKVSEAAVILGEYSKHWILKGNKRINLLIYDEMNSYGGEFTRCSIYLYCWNKRGIDLCSTISETEGTTTYTTDEKGKEKVTSNVVYPKITGTTIVVGKTIYTWNPEKEVFDVK